MANIIDVAQFFLGKADEDNEKITHLKLQKLCYYAKSWGLAIANDPIFDEKFQAWVHGPVNEKLYNIYKDYGFEQIFYDNALKTGTFTSRQKKLLEAVWKTYGHYDAKVLEGFTHREKPWKDARKGLEDYEYSTSPIDEENMKNYYKSVLNKS
ncbi:Panacea domain-containing protein [Paenibacillus sp. FSL R7-0333]|uniref:Panacea domain-containing protein n=1 Tax=Paenibacillus sp. FSL R7-0333 TaxID=1926587 RepID=UPI00096EBC1A|nr:hypothetical protein BK146_24650 [Paenibacillus sp. FSL R7-0333]